ncbi:putative oxidoreductase, aryl-alcohol dehydrogenase like protein [Frankia sp. EI5c]|uniref:aldo/keto reductase n=1 Tax=Frankia sp. EI5c TaxID=683316 RepID=UPI0007C2B7C5|nr:aldo/keto reductase [Frankia sp. EI5c]OAA25458.1 putative oxidoreductase, aryl-alcohol dehydrogenase like protein [Frankia sp. EI5c]
MRYVDVVSTTKKISRIGLGTWQFGSREWGYGSSYAQTDAALIVRRALELGVTLFDTAEMYAFGRSERILGDALAEAAGAAGAAFIATKIFPVLPVAPVVEQRAIASANRLGVRTIDLYQVHQPNPVVRDRTTMRGMASLRRVGLVDEVGVSNYSLERWRAAEEALGSRVLSNQVQYSLVRRQPERDLIPFARREGRLIIAYSPLAQGLLSGRYDVTNRPTGAVRRANPLFLTENLARLAPLLDVLREVAVAHGVTVPQIALAWVVHHPNVVAIPGASSVAQLESNAAAADITLTDDEYDALTSAAENFSPLTGPASWAAMAAERVGRP